MIVAFFALALSTIFSLVGLDNVINYGYRYMGYFATVTFIIPLLTIGRYKNKKSEKGILICRSGLGMAICANKFKGIRCTPCHNEYTARYSRLHNDSNILAMGADDVSISEAICILRMWLATEFEGGRHEERLRIIEEIENENMK